ncbi:MAG: outer membrane protein assembly factor BamA [Phycisphaerales bacterium]
MTPPLQRQCVVVRPWARSKPATRGREGGALALLVAACGLATGFPALAQQAAPTPVEQASPLEGRPIRAVRFIGVETVDDEFIRNQLRTEVGQPLRQATVTDDVSRLYRLGRFRAIDASVTVLGDGGVEVVFTFNEAPIVRDVQVTGNRNVRTNELSAVISGVNLRAGVPVDDFRVGKARRAIEEFYRERGYYTVEVFVDDAELDEKGIVLFRVREGQRVRVTDIRFEGVEALEIAQVRSRIQTRKRGLFSKGPLDEETLERDVAELIRFYRDFGYLDARADRRITPSPNGREAIITFVIDEGPLYTLRDLRVVPEGAPMTDDGMSLAITPDQVAGLLPIKLGDAYGLRQARQAQELIQRAYFRLGFADAQVRVQELRDPDRPVVDLLISVSEGKRYRTGEIVIQGNSLTRQNVVRREVEAKPEEPLDRGALDDSRRRLEQLRLFQPGSVKITVQPERADEPGYRDVLVEVEETNTGSVGFIVAVNSDAGVVGGLSVSQRNFDIGDTPETLGEFISGRAFRGAAQTFNLTIAPGTEVQTYGISLSDPSLFDTDTAASASFAFRDRIFEDYDEERWGPGFRLGRRVGDRWNAALAFRFEQVELTDIEPDAPVDVFEAAEQSWVNGAGVRLSRTTVPPLEGQSPSRGLRTTLTAEQVFGDYSFTKLGFSQDIFFTVAEDALGRRSKLSFTLDTNWIPQENEAPVYEKYYLGGRTMRGFEFRTISPKGIRNDTGEVGEDPVGGNWLFFLGAEYEVPLFGEIPVSATVVDPVFSLVTFLDTGTVLDEPGFDDYRVSVGLGVRIRVPALGPAPLAFDFGFPIKKEDLDEERLFSFSVDLPF